MDELSVEAVQLELKYCERCGGLWLRPRGSGLVFCGSCARVMAGLLWSPRASLASPGKASAKHADQTFFSEGGTA